MNHESQPLVSVVTPVFNEEQYLATCIESVLNQTYSNWEYSIIDNCSSDRSLEIARRYAAADSRIHIHANERFLPMLANHNNALRKTSTSSKYCKMVLADDWIYPTCLERMVGVAESHPTVGVVSAHERCGDEIRITGLPKDEVLVPGREACRSFLLDKLLLFGSQNSVMFRSEFIRRRDPFFVEDEPYADFESCFYILRTSDLGFVHEVLTCSTKRSQSAGAVASDTGAHFRSMLGLIRTYGHDILTPEDYRRALDRVLEQYYRFLGRRLYVEWSSGFWSYHNHTLTESGLVFNRKRLALSALSQLFELIVKPGATFESALRLFRLRMIRTGHVRKTLSGFQPNP